MKMLSQMAVKRRSRYGSHSPVALDGHERTVAVDGFREELVGSEVVAADEPSQPCNQ